MRCAYAAWLFIAFCVVFYGEAREVRSGFELLGRGRGMFVALVYIQFVGVLAFLPATMSGVITQEKEQRSLELLLLTDLRPSEILLQKYLGHLIPIFTFLLLSLPLLAICYAFGGVSPELLWTAVALLVLHCLQVGAWALLWSCYCRTSLSAFVATYALGVPLYLLAAIWLVHIRFSFAAPVAFGIATDLPGEAGTELIVSCVGILASAVLCLLLARRALVARAFVPRKSTVLTLFQRLDRFFERANRVVGGIMLVKQKGMLPGDEPVAWREVTKRSLGKPQYLFRVLVLIEVPVLFIAADRLLAGAAYGEETLSPLIFILWALAVLLLCVVGANAVASERASQTLDVLLTTPLTGEEILRQKHRAARRLILVLLVPFFTLFAMKASFGSGLELDLLRLRFPRTYLCYIAASVCSVLIFLPLVAWFSLWVSLRVRTRSRAILTALVALMVWWAGPLLLAGLIGPGHLGTWVLLSFASPAATIFLIEQLPRTLEAVVGLGLFVGYYAWYGSIAVALRRSCLTRADRLLGRASPGEFARQG